MNTFFPVFINMDQMKIVCIGGGNIAQRRIKTLLEFGAKITLISPEATADLVKMADEKQILWIQREYQRGDLSDPSIGMAVIATNVREINHEAGSEAKENAIPVTVADKKEECSFYFPGIAKKDDVVVGITTGGKDHKKASSITSKIRQFLEEL